MIHFYDFDDHYFIPSTDVGSPTGFFACLHPFTCVYKYFVIFFGSSVLALNENIEGAPSGLSW